MSQNPGWWRRCLLCHFSFMLVHLPYAVTYAHIYSTQFATGSCLGEGLKDSGAVLCRAAGTVRRVCVSTEAILAIVSSREDV